MGSLEGTSMNADLLSDIIEDMVELEQEKARVLIQNDTGALAALLLREEQLVSSLSRVSPVDDTDLGHGWDCLVGLRERNRSLLEATLAFTRYSLHLLHRAATGGMYSAGGMESGAQTGFRVNRQA